MILQFVTVKHIFFKSNCSDNQTCFSFSNSTYIYKFKRLGFFAFGNAYHHRLMQAVYLVCIMTFLFHYSEIKSQIFIYLLVLWHLSLQKIHKCPTNSQYPFLRPIPSFNRFGWFMNLVFPLILLRNSGEALYPDSKKNHDIFRLFYDTI